ncbi:uncharacterized protein EDB93DRAFT_1101556 [Suillus bovinus]|uniref:uncharacterized protein n=1 Tax=Suillus bovinus TaxID=48563 RepID=UPI001B881108|nr:uncharacterized protein EDB93DRAFT_1101556 [Suillus bovinus]KAG2156709.1 hypothetical protein EDB93DRAFT_1101556 [Suillus bovinus]
MPELDEPPKGLPEGAVDLGDEQYALTITTFLGNGHQLPHIQKWAWLRLANGQTAHSSWREKLKLLEKTCMSRNIKNADDLEEDADDNKNDNEWHLKNVVVMQMYSVPNKELLKLSSQALVFCTFLDNILAIDVKVIAMVPHMPILLSGVMESLEISNLGVPYSGFYIRGGDEPEDDDSDNGADLE